ncbi:MAG: PaaI family thioesterase [Magnetospirillum sp.]|nr:MAG: PaaI family thioesterase [Magnetospirillum sp.]
MSAISAETFNALLTEKLPMGVALGIRAETIGKGTARLIMPFGPHLTRPVDVVCGPALMTLADVALYAAVLSAIGLQEMAVTSNLNISFLRKAERCDIIAEASLLKLGRRLAMGAVEMIAAGTDELVAHVTATYAIP